MFVDHISIHGIYKFIECCCSLRNLWNGLYQRRQAKRTYSHGPYQITVSMSIVQQGVYVQRGV